MQSLYWYGDLAEFTGNSFALYGGIFYEYKLLEGHKQGQLVLTQRKPQ